MKGEEQPSRLQLVKFVGEKGEVEISLEKKVTFSKRFVQSLGGVRETVVDHRVRFNYLGYQFDNYFTALAALEAVLGKFLRGKFGQHEQRVHSAFYCDGRRYAVEAEKIKQGRGRLPLLRLGFYGVEKNIVVNDIYAQQIHTAARKAMNWLSPTQDKNN